MKSKSVSYLITGGSRSGKSAYALKLAENAKKPFFIATGWAGDEEMHERIKKHQAERGEHWTTIETRTEIADAILQAGNKGADFILIDCLTLWASNVLFEGKEELQEKITEITKIIPNVKVPLVFVTNEVGSGIVPADRISREFRDAAGSVNQSIAANVDNVVLAVCGIPSYIKGRSE